MVLQDLWRSLILWADLLLRAFWVTTSFGLLERWKLIVEIEFLIALTRYIFHFGVGRTLLRVWCPGLALRGSIVDPCHILCQQSCCSLQPKQIWILLPLSGHWSLDLWQLDDPSSSRFQVGTDHLKEALSVRRLDKLHLMSTHLGTIWCLASHLIELYSCVVLLHTTVLFPHCGRQRFYHSCWRF